MTLKQYIEEMERYLAAEARAKQVKRAKVLEHLSVYYMAETDRVFDEELTPMLEGMGISLAKRD